MRKTGTWMRQLDERLLEHLGEIDWLTPQMLADARLVWLEHEDIYEITTWGQQYLEGELDAENQPRPRPGRVS